MNAALERPIKVAPLASSDPQRTASRLASSAAALSTQLFAVHEPTGARAEALRELRSQLILRWFGEHRTLAVITPHAADDGDTVAANLAIAMAQLGEPTLLIDANLRAPRQHELFGLKPAAGLSDLLRNRDVHDLAMLQVPALEQLHVLCSGSIPTNPQELISRTPFIYLMKTLPERFRRIIVATPPALAYADAQVIAARAHGCLLVTRRHHTRIADIARIKDQLVPGGAVLVGGVIRE